MTVWSTCIRRDTKSGMETWWHFDDVTRQYHVEERQSSDAIIGALRRACFNRHVQEHTRPKDEYVVASVPKAVELQWAKEAGVRWNSPEYMEVHERKIMDSDYSKFRVDR